MADTIDLRSDTVTKPTPGMRAAIAAAEVGDDVFREDPTVLKLEERVARMLGKEAALLVPSGTMSNQICVRTHTHPGDEMLCDLNCHIYKYEAGGAAVLSGVTCRTLEGDYGILDLTQLQDMIQPANDHLVHTRAGVPGKYAQPRRRQDLSAGKDPGHQPLGPSKRPGHAPRRRPSVERHRRHRHPGPGMVPQLRQRLGLFQQGAGSADRLGPGRQPRSSSQRARKNRKLFGGGMRQAGILAAACLYALDHHIERLAEDHRNAQVLAQAIAATPGLHLTPAEVETNLIFAQHRPRPGHRQGRGRQAQGTRRAGAADRPADRAHVHASGCVRRPDRKGRQHHPANAAPESGGMTTWQANHEPRLCAGQASL